MKEGKIISILLITVVFSLVQGIPVTTGGADQKEMAFQEQRVLEWRKERDAFFKNHRRSPLLPQAKKNLKD